MDILYWARCAIRLNIHGKLSFLWLKMIKNKRKMIKIARGFRVYYRTLGLGHVTKSMRNFAVQYHFRALFVREALCWSQERVISWRRVLSWMSRYRFLVELPARPNLLFAPGQYRADAVSLTYPLSNPLVNNKFPMRLIRSLSFCLRLDEYLSVWKSTIIYTIRKKR